jgi:hypothetical protein
MHYGCLVFFASLAFAQNMPPIDEFDIEQLSTEPEPELMVFHSSFPLASGNSDGPKLLLQSNGTNDTGSDDSHSNVPLVIVCGLIVGVVAYGVLCIPRRKSSNQAKKDDDKEEQEEEKSTGLFVGLEIERPLF